MTAQDGMLTPLRPPLLLLLCLLLASAPGLGGQQQQQQLLLHAAGHRREPSHLALFPTGSLQVELQSGVFLRANATRLRKSGEWVEVSWSGVPAPRSDDLVALFPADADPNDVAPIKFKHASASPPHLQLGAGSATFRLLNMRRSVRFALVRGGAAPAVAAWTPPISFAHRNEPTQGHLTVTGDASTMRVQWVTADVGRPRVRWGSGPGRLTASAAAASATYTRAEMCGPPANASGWFDPGKLHSAVMTGLPPGGRVWYRYGDEDHGLWSEEASFLALPAPGGGASVSLLAVADLGAAEADGSSEVSEMAAALGTAALLAAEAHRHNLLVHNGDVSYARGYGSQWDAFFDQMAPTLSRVPYLTAVGNHERDWPGSGDRFPAQYDSGGECGVPYYRRTQMPAGGGEDRPWFSVDVGPVHLLQYSTEHAFHPGSEQYAFMAADLAAVDRAATPWVIVGGHRPMYVDSILFEGPPDGDGYVAGLLREALEPLFHRHRVDATWHGHHHSYQRTCPVLRGRCQEAEEGGGAGGAVHLVIGHGGAGLSPNVHLRRPAIFEEVQLRHGYMRVAANATHLHHQVVASPSGETMDEFALTKPPGWVYTPRELPPELEGLPADPLPAAAAA